MIVQFNWVSPESAEKIKRKIYSRQRVCVMMVVLNKTNYRLGVFRFGVKFG